MRENGNSLDIQLQLVTKLPSPMVDENALADIIYLLLCCSSSENDAACNVPIDSFFL